MSTERLSEETELNLIRLMMEHGGEPAGELSLDQFVPMPDEQYQALRQVIHENADKIMVQTLMTALREKDKELVTMKNRADRAMQRVLDYKKVPSEVEPEEREYVPPRGWQKRKFGEHGTRAIPAKEAVHTYCELVGLTPSDPITEEIAKFYAWLRQP